ncbi:MAG: ATP-binding protein, partial [Bryobacteraceae bacterium]
EAHARQERNVKLRTQMARFPDPKRLEQFDFQFPTSIDEKKIRELASLRFLERHENVCLLACARVAAARAPDAGPKRHDRFGLAAVSGVG